ncbi:hypothetical protein ACFL6I_00025 [candidate division KSB1 bacterium]
MSTLAAEISEKIIAQANTEEVVFLRSDKIDNLMQLLFEQRITAKDIGDAVVASAPKEEHKKILCFFASKLIAYLSEKLTKTKLKGFRGAPKKPEQQEQKKLSKSEEFLLRREREKKEKEQQKSKSDGKIEKISLKEVGKQMKEEEEKQKETDEKIKSAQDSALEEQQKHIGAYKTAFDIYAYAVEYTIGKEKNTAEICELIRKMGSSEMTSRHVALDKMSRHPDSILGLEALISCLKDKNITINVIQVLHNIGDRRAIIPLINIIKEFPTPDDILFRGPAEQAIGEIIRQMSEKSKGSGAKYIYQIVMKDTFEPKIRLFVKIIGRDVSNPKIRSEYFTPQCIKLLSAVVSKVYEAKKKKVKVGFVNVSVQTDLSKELRALLTALNAA